MANQKSRIHQNFESFIGNKFLNLRDLEAGGSNVVALCTALVRSVASVRWVEKLAAAARNVPQSTYRVVDQPFFHQQILGVKYYKLSAIE